MRLEEHFRKALDSALRGAAPFPSTLELPGLGVFGAGESGCGQSNIWSFKTRGHTSFVPQPGSKLGCWYTGKPLTIAGSNSVQHTSRSTQGY